MNPNFVILVKDDKKCPIAKRQGEKILESLEYSGVFSEEFKEKIRHLVAENFYDILNKRDKGMENFQKFHKLLNMYIIFSDVYKSELEVLFMSMYNKS